MLSERYFITENEKDFSHVLPDLISELQAVQFALERMGLNKEAMPDHAEIFGTGLILGRLVADFRFINDSLYGRHETSASEAEIRTISKNEA